MAVGSEAGNVSALRSLSVSRAEPHWPSLCRNTCLYVYHIIINQIRAMSTLDGLLLRKKKAQGIRYFWRTPAQRRRCLCAAVQQNGDGISRFFRRVKPTNHASIISSPSS